MHARNLTLFALLWLAGCSSVPSLLYKIEIQQGNVVTQEMVDKLKPGMSRSQVRFVLGSPMISDAFHENRWDYIYRFDKRGRLVEQRNLTVFFEDDKLARISGSFAMPSAFSGSQPVEPPSVAEFVPQRDTNRQMIEGFGESPTPVPGTMEPRGDVPASADVPVLSAPPSGAAVPAPGGTLAAPVSPESAVSETTSELAVPEQPSPRLVPSQARDTGFGGADQLKE